MEKSLIYYNNEWDKKAAGYLLNWIYPSWLLKEGPEKKMVSVIPLLNLTHLRTPKWVRVEEWNGGLRKPTSSACAVIALQRWHIPNLWTMNLKQAQFGKSAYIMLTSLSPKAQMDISKPDVSQNVNISVHHANSLPVWLGRRAAFPMFVRWRRNLIYMRLVDL